MRDLLTRLRADIPTLALNDRQKAVLSAVVDAAAAKHLTETRAPTPATAAIPTPNAHTKVRIAEVS
jgi:hypothetical protein